MRNDIKNKLITISYKKYKNHLFGGPIVAFNGFSYDFKILEIIKIMIPLFDRDYNDSENIYSDI